MTSDTPDYLAEFTNHALLWTDKRQFWKNQGNVYINDNEALTKMFEGKPSMAFLKLPSNYFPRLERLIRELGIRRFSEVVKTRLAADDLSARTEESRTEQIRTLFPYVARFFYNLEYESYKKLRETDALRNLRNITCYSVSNLQAEYYVQVTVVQDDGSKLPVLYSTTAQKNVVLDRGSLYVQSDRLEDNDEIALEISRLFGSPRGLDDFFASLLNKAGKEEIESLMRLKGIPPLPVEEQKLLLPLAPAARDARGASQTIDERENGNGEGIADKIATENQGSASAEAGSEEECKPPQRDGPGGAPTGTPTQRGTNTWQPQCAPDEVIVRIEKSPRVAIRTKKVEAVIGNGGSLELAFKLEGAAPDPSDPGIEEMEPPSALTAEEKKAIGRWGEEYALKCIKDWCQAKYSSSRLEDTVDGFHICSGDGRILFDVHWLNNADDRGVGHDIKVIENGVEEFVEVKSTRTDDKEWFEVSQSQWAFAQQMRSRFHIYRVYSAGTEQARLVDIADPFGRWEDGELIAYPIRVKA